MSRRVSVVTGSSIGAVSVAVTRAASARRGGERRGPGLYVALADRGGVAVEGPEDRLRTSLADPVEFHQSLAGVLGVHLAEVVGVLDQGLVDSAPQPPSVRRTRLVVPRSETVRIRPSVSRSIART